MSLTSNLCTVLLLDEADVFLEERSLSDLERNSLVSGRLSQPRYLSSCAGIES